MRVVSHPEADQELEAAALWYEARQPGLGEPERWHTIRGDNRKLNFHRFPYAIVYNLRPDAIYIKAVMHLHRRPFYWRERQ